jgi:hypothetical protein
VHLCVLCVSQNKQRLFPYTNFITETGCVYCPVRIEPLHIIQSNFCLGPVKIPGISVSNTTVLCAIPVTHICAWKVRPRTGQEGPEGQYSHRPSLSLTSALVEDEWSKPSPVRFIPGKDPVPIV